MAKQITELTLLDFPNVYTLNDRIRLVTNIPNLNPGLLGSRNRGYFIRVFNSTNTIPKIKSIYVSPQIDFYAYDNTSSLKLPDSNQFRAVSSLDNNCITTDTLGVAMKWFNNRMQHIVWAYFVTDDTPDLEHINPSLKADNVTVSITGNTVNLKANSGYTIKDATLNIGNSLFGDYTPLDFTISQDKTTATVTVTDQSLIDPSQQYTLTVHTKVNTDLEHINPSLKADNVSVSITGNTVNLKANSGYTIKNATLDIGNSLFGDGTTLDFTVSPDKNTATLTITDDSLIDASQEYNLTVHTEEVPPYTLQNVGLQCNDENVTLSVNNNTATLTAKSGYKITSAIITSKNKYDFSGSTRQDHNFTINADGSSATLTLTPSKNLDYTLNVSSTEKPQPTPPAETQPTKPTETQPPTETPTQPTPPAETQPIETNYKVDVSQIKDYIDYKADGLIITLTAKQNVTINSLRAVADLTWAGDTHQLDTSVIKIADNKKTATITVPNDYNSKLWYTIVISGDFTKDTPIPINPKATGTLHVYQLDDKALEDFSTKAVETFNSGLNETYDFQKFITQLYKLPFFVPKTESTGTTNILTGWYTINEPARLLNKNHYVKDLGNIKVLPVNNNGYDHNVASCTLYLPFVSPISISYETVLNHTVNIKYDTDLAGAKTTVNIFVDNELYKTIQVSIIENLDLYNIYNDSINGSLSSILNNTLNNCFIKVEYNKPIENLVSYETLEHNKLSNYTNFVKTKNANVSCGTQQEQTEIENLLNGGIYIK